MHIHYDDILDKIGVPPLWWDEHAVPRFCAFAPDKTADIYADEAALVLIGCQACGHQFKVAFSCSPLDRYRPGQPVSSLADRIMEKTLHYGDPPNDGCCAAGPTMNCLDYRVIEYWRRGKNYTGWERHPDLERDLADAEAIAS